jgi:hypothetical protein
MTALRRDLVPVGFLGLLGALLAALGAPAAPQEPAPEAAPVVNDARFHDQLLKVAQGYTAYGRVDDEMRWAPFLCRMPLAGQARFSRSADEATHGRKLYSVFAARRDAYLTAPTQPSPVGQVIVKESWAPEEVPNRKPGQPRFEDTIRSPEKGYDPMRTDHFNPYAERDGKVYKAAKKGPLFVMLKLAPETPGSDDGWVYGTVTADGKTVTSAGRVASCMKCHEARKDRLFGLRAEGPSQKGKP